eukprot:jgi/Tetstr1/438215/TSEL_002870.t1
MICNGVGIPFKDGPPAPFHRGVSMEVATPDQLRFMRDGDVVAWAAVLVHINGRSIYKSVETVYMHVDSSGYVRGAVLKERTEAPGFCYNGDREPHITYKELKAVRFAVLTFLSEPRGRQVLLHEDNMGVVYVLANLTSRSYYLLMTELRMLWFILDTN